MKISGMIILIGILGWLVLSNLESHRQKQLKRIYPFIHMACKQYHDTKDYSSVCEDCKKSYIKDGSIRLVKLFKQWERAKGKPWGEGGLTDYDVEEFCQIIDNHKILIYR